MSTQSSTVSPAAPPHSAHRLRFPSAFTVLFAVTLVVWVLAFVIPTGAYKVSDKTGGPIPGSYHSVDAGLSFSERLMQLFLAPVNGLYGIKASEGGFIGPSFS